MRENMSSNELLARRAVACKGWRWMPGMGMLTDVGERVTDPTICYLGTLPDFSDPATLGCLLALVREAWGDVQIIMTYSPCVGWWNLYFDEHPDRVEFVGLSLAEALVAALEAAP
jgi:hypothetical protein